MTDAPLMDARSVHGNYWDACDACDTIDDLRAERDAARADADALADALRNCNRHVGLLAGERNALAAHDAEVAKR